MNKETELAPMKVFPDLFTEKEIRRMRDDMMLGSVRAHIVMQVQEEALEGKNESVISVLKLSPEAVKCLANELCTRFQMVYKWGANRWIRYFGAEESSINTDSLKILY